MSWEQLYDLFGIKDFIYFISSPSIQHALFWPKLVFVLFTAAFFVMAMWFYVNSSYLQDNFLQDANEFMAWESYGTEMIKRHWKKIMKRAESGLPADIKLSIIEADDLLFQALETMGYKGESFGDLVNNAASKKDELEVQRILRAHEIRNAIVYQSDYDMEVGEGKQILLDYEKAIELVIS